jgi:hypothetical protein
MGLDMYLNASRYLSDYNEADKQKKEQLFKLFPELKAYTAQATKEVTVEVGYWRKANAIHNWFVHNVQNGEDNCAKYNVHPDHLMKLKSLCEQVLADHNLAGELLPPTGGFFFGSTELDEGYFDDLRSTIEIIDRVLALPDGWWIEYQSSW